MPAPTPCLTPQRAQHERSVTDKCVGSDLPIDAPSPRLAVPGSFHDAVQEEVRVQLGSLHHALDEFEQHVESSESKQRLLESLREL